MVKNAENRKKVDAVVLAAGFSSRTGPGRFKMELPLRGKTVLENTIASLQPCCSRVIVVGGYKYERIKAIVESYPFVETVFNKDYESGMFTSVKTGFARVTSEWFLYTPGDYPMIDADTCRELLNSRTAFPGNHIFIPVYKGRKGHPVLMSRELIPGLLAEPEDSNLRVFINRMGYVPVEVGDSGILSDIDTIEDYHRLEEKIKMPGK